MNVCRFAASMTFHTLTLKLALTSLWNRSDIEQVNTRRGERQCRGSSSLSGCRVTLNGSSAGYPYRPARRFDIRRAQQF